VRRPALAAVVCVALLSGCGTGLQAQTYKARTAGSTVGADVNGLALRGLAIDLDGTDATAAPQLSGVIVNNGTQDDQLVNATTSVASGVQFLSATGAPVLDIPAGRSSGTDWALQLDGLRAPLVPGSFVQVELQFAKAGRVPLSVPVRTADNGLKDRKAEQDPYGEG
jgi:hypothetical protein